MFDAYMKLSGYEMEESIQRETSGALKDLLLAVGKNTGQPFTETHSVKHFLEFIVCFFLNDSALFFL